MSIFDLMNSAELVAYWEELVKDEAPYPCEELFPDDKKRGLKLEWLMGANGLPIVLKNSAFDAVAIPRGRIGFEKMESQMPYFKESMYIDEELRQELNLVLETGNQAYIDSVMNHIFNDETRLLRGARASRERMRMMALTSGVIAMAANGQTFSYDYQIPAANKVEASVSWSDHTNSDPIEDIRVLKEDIEQRAGCKITRAMCDGKTWRDLRANEKIKNDIYAIRSNVGSITNKMLQDYIADQLDGLAVRTNDMRYADENETTQKFMPTDTFVIFPGNPLGKTMFGTTPQESDLMAGNAANVTITDMGVSVTTVQKTDPVNVETIVAMICLPSFEQAHTVGIIDTVK